MSEKLLMATFPPDMRQSFLDSMQEASKINRELLFGKPDEYESDWVAKKDCKDQEDLETA